MEQVFEHAGKTSLGKLKKVIYIISDIDKALSFEWIALGLQSKFDLTFILIGKEGSDFSFFLKRHSIKCYEITHGGYKSRFAKWWAVFNILRKEKPVTVHTHLWQANLIGLSAAWVLRINKRIYTRHHAITHYLEYPSGRKWDLLCNFLATDIVAISQNVKKILIDRDKAMQKKITTIYHGFDFNYFAEVSNDRVHKLRVQYSLFETSFPIVGVIARHLEWKGIQYIIPAFQKLRKEFPEAHLVLANANGSYRNQIQEVLSVLPPGSYTAISFENDLVALYKIFNVYVHVPIDSESEAFGQTYVEALICGVPSVFTLSGIAPEFIVDRKNALVVPFKDSDAIHAALKEILSNRALSDQLVQNGKAAVKLFSLQGMITALEDLYSR